MKKLSILLLILLSFGLLSCEMTVAQDESALVMKLDALSDAVDVLEAYVGNPTMTVEQLEKELSNIKDLIGSLEDVDSIIYLLSDLQEQIDNLPPTTTVVNAWNVEIKNSVIELILAVNVEIRNKR